MDGLESIRRAMADAEIVSDGREDDDACVILDDVSVLDDDGDAESSRSSVSEISERNLGEAEGLPSPGGPHDFGYDIDALNKEFALVLLGSKAVIYMERDDAKLDEQKRFLTIEAFRAWFNNRFTEIAVRGETKVKSWADRWLSDRDRRSYKGIEFFPNPDGVPATPDYLNLWSGFICEPKAKPNGYAVFKDHLLNNLCEGNKKLYDWVFGFFAHMVQRPRERVGVALVMRGKMGTGKTKIGETFGSLFPRHYFLVDDPRYVTGQFNAHMASCLLLQADEAVWAGDKAAEGRLKGLITAPFQQIEAKGVDPIRLDNYVRLVMTSNEDWVVPAGKDERRFCVLDVNPRCAQNSDYFSEMDSELDNGGRAALLFDLLKFDCTKINLRQIPRTRALLEQKVLSFESIDRWWFGCLDRGTPTRHHSAWAREVAKSALVDDYIFVSDRVGQKRKAAETELSMKLRKIVPGLRDKLGWSEGAEAKRQPFWVMPTLEECRAAFAESLQQEVEWAEMRESEEAA